MFWEKRKKEVTLPDLPISPESRLPPRFDSSRIPDELDEAEVHELPSFPDSPMQQGFSQSAIKEAVTNEDADETFPELKRPNREISSSGYKVVEMSDWSKPLPLRPSPPSVKENKPIFVRIDKFQLARASLETVKLKLGEIESLLKQIRDVKAKEDQELSSWETELENIKSRIQSITSDIFDKTED